ncbi:MAG: hypothetical protein NTZ55_05885 [Candidatus Roizmanbacteria bacterium]|nr:hypothetical protein [Candidatus Roizmanbacteria bacterium]
MNKETIIPILLVVVIIFVGLLLKRLINLRNAWKLMRSLGKKINAVYHSVPLWVRLTILISIPFVIFFIFAIDVELNHPERQFTIHDLPFLP